VRVALITGSAGARQLTLSLALQQAGWEVRSALFQGHERPDLAAAAAGVEVVFHVGIRTPREDSAEMRASLEADAAHTAAIAARDAGARRIVMLSAASVYGRPQNLPVREGDPKRPRTPEERARWRAEQAAWGAFREGAPLTVLRPTILYGPTLRGGAIRALSLIALVSRGRRRIPIIRRGPVAHLLHVQDLARAAIHVAEHREDRDVLGRAFHVADDAPLPLAEHLAAALAAMGYSPGRILPYSPRMTGMLLWLVRNVPDRVLVDPVNRRLLSAWQRYVGGDAAHAALAPRIDREALHWMSADHYYDTSRIAALGWRPEYPISTAALPGTIRALMSARLLPEGAAPALPEAFR
jgi:nucleoside-diphosphate-sugar epimerase